MLPAIPHLKRVKHTHSLISISTWKGKKSVILFHNIVPVLTTGKVEPILFSNKKYV